MDFSGLKNILSKRKNSLEEYLYLQLELFKNIQNGPGSKTRDLENELETVNKDIETQRLVLQPLLKEWGRLEAQQKSVHLKGEIGQILNEIEGIAHKIEGDHKLQNKEIGSNEGMKTQFNSQLAQNSIYLSK